MNLYRPNLWVFAGVCASIGLLSGCQQKPKVAADQPVPVELRAPHRLHQPASVSASGSVEANVTAQTAFQVGGRVARVFVEEGQSRQAGSATGRARLFRLSQCIRGRCRSGDSGRSQPHSRRRTGRGRRNSSRRASIRARAGRVPAEQVPLRSSKPCRPTTSTRSKRPIWSRSSGTTWLARARAVEEKASHVGARRMRPMRQLSEAKKHLGDCQLGRPSAASSACDKSTSAIRCAAGNPVFSVLDLDPVKVRVGIPEAEIGKVHEGARALVTIPSLDNQQFEGKVEAVGYSADSVSRTFTTKIAIPNPKPRSARRHDQRIARLRLRDD